MFDIDKTGWSIRPLYTVEGANHSVLFPLSNWNPSSGKGWTFPLGINADDWGYLGPYWWNKDYKGILLSGLKDDGGFLGPFYFNSKNKKNISTGIFPLYGYKKSYATGRHYLGAGILSYIRNSKNSHTYWIIPWLDHRSENGFLKMLLPAYAYYTSKEGKIFLSPAFFAGWNDDGELDFANLLGILYHYGDNKHRILGGGLLYSNVKSESDYSRWILPWYSSASAKGIKNILFPFYHYSSTSKESQLLTPLVGVKKGKNGLKINNLLGPLYIDTSDESQSQAHTFAPLSYFANSKYNDDYTRWVFPWLSIKEGGKRSNMLFPLFYHSSGEAEKDNLLITPFYMSGTNDHGDETFQSILGPLLINVNGLGEHYTSFAWPFITYKKYISSGNSNFLLFPFVYSQDNSSQGVDISAALWTLGYRSATNAWRIWPFFNYKQRHAVPSVINYDTNEFSILGELGVKFKYRDITVPKLFKTSEIAASLNLRHRTKTYLLFFKSTSFSRFPYETTLFTGENKKSNVRYTSVRKRLGIFNYEQLRDICLKPGALNKIDIKRISTILSEGDYNDAAEFLTFQGINSKAQSEEEIVEQMYKYLDSVTVRSQKTKWSVPLLIHSSTETDREHFDILWQLYSMDRDRDAVTRDIFPFIQTLSSKDKTSFAFMWRLFNYENKKGKRTGHFFFIPWSI